MTNNDMAPRFSIGQTVTVEDRTGTVVALQPAADSISGKAVARVELHTYGNRAWFDANTVKPVYKIGQTVRFTLGHTPMLGTILFAVGTGAAAVKLPSGAETIIDLDTIDGPAGK